MRPTASAPRVVTCGSVALLNLLTLGASYLRAQDGDWPCFRGPNRAGVSTARGLPQEWSETKNIVWKSPLPGAGASSPVTFGDRIFLTCYSGYGLSRESPGKYENLQRHVICLRRQDGKILWNDAFANKVPDDHYGDFINLHGYASSTPAVDETGLYVFFGTTGVRAYSHEGGLKWEQPCGKRYTNFGSASSPVLFGDLVIINASVEGNAVIALEKRTGREAWRVATAGDSRCTPLLVVNRDSHELVFHSGESHAQGAKPSELVAVDPRNGGRLWECVSIKNYLNPSPITHGGVIYAVGGHPNRAIAIRGGGRGDVSLSHVVWDIKHGGEICTPVFHNGHLYWTNEESGVAYCVDAKTGDVVYKERLEPRPGRIYASGILGDGKLYYVSRENGTFVLSAEPRYKLLAHNTIGTDKSVFNATPAVSRGQLLLRSDRCLYCIGKDSR
jgi:outer membrane protein assembly factor BamB